MVRKTNRNLEDTSHTVLYTEPASSSIRADCSYSEIESTESIEFSPDYSSEPLSTPGPIFATPRNVLPENPGPAVSFPDYSTQLPAVGNNISIYWPLDNRYYPYRMFTVEDSDHTILYNDGDVERLDLSSKTWRFFSAFTNEGPSPAVKSDLPIVLFSMFEYFGS